MTRFLRTASTRRLLATITAAVVIGGGGAAIAVAATSGGPVPKRESLAAAIRGVLAAPPVQAISARITFTNHLVDASNLETSDPLLTGASGRLWASADGRIRIELQSDNGDAEALFDHGRFWISDPAMQTVYEGKLPAGTGAGHSGSAQLAHHDALPTIAQIQQAINRVAQHLVVSGATPTDVGGQPAYNVQISPKPSEGGLIGAVGLAFDSARGIPLRFALYAKGDSTPVLELTASDISFGAVPASDFAITPPSGSNVVNVDLSGVGRHAAARGAKAAHTRHAPVAGVNAVAARLPFTLDAPATLGGLSRSGVRLLGSDGALVTYGQNLSAVAVIEHAAKSSGAGSAGAANSGGPGGGPSLPTVTINGTSATELATPLGTVLSFTRGGVGYTVLGSVATGTVVSVARGL